MTIGGFSDYGYMYHPYPMERIPSVDANAASQATGQTKQQEVPTQGKQLTDIPVSSEAPAVERKNTALEDISLTFHKDDTFDMIGSSSDLTKLDMDKAISDMKKDSILQDYSYFVGAPSGRIQSASEDGIVIAK